jgi:hypothetical protein
MMGTTENIENKNSQKAFDKDRHYPTVEVAEARIKQALLRYKITIERTTPTTEKEKVRL